MVGLNATAVDILLIEVRNVLFIGLEIALIFALDDADITDLLPLFGMVLAFLLYIRELLPRVNQLFYFLLISIQFFDELNFAIELFISQNHQSFFEFSHLNELFIDDCPHRIDESTLQQFSWVAVPIIT